MNSAWDMLAAIAGTLAVSPWAFFWGCSPCCKSCDFYENLKKPSSDPKDEGTWVPSGTWRGVGGVTWSFSPNPGDESGETWYFYGSQNTSDPSGFATVEEQRDWGNICNWYSNKTNAPSDLSQGNFAPLNKRATRLPTEDAVVHIYTPVSTVLVGPQTVKNIYFWGASPPTLSRGGLGANSEITTTAPAHDSSGGAVFNGYAFTSPGSTVNNGATFNDNSAMSVSSPSNVINGGATFNHNSIARLRVNGGATFNDSARSFSAVFNALAPCQTIYGVHPTDVPTCNGTAPTYCTSPFSGGCG